jgi:hypothetical protein
MQSLINTVNKVTNLPPEETSKVIVIPSSPEALSERRRCAKLAVEISREFAYSQNGTCSHTARQKLLELGADLEDRIMHPEKYE